MNERGSIELVVLGLLAALVVVLAIPMLQGVHRSVAADQTDTRTPAK